MGKDVLETVYETLLCSPGMNDAVKVDVKVSRKVVLLLNSVIEKGLAKGQDKGQNVLGFVPESDLEELRSFGEECLQKAGLKELSEKIRTLHE